MAALTEKCFNNSIGGFVLYAKSTVDDSLVAVKVDPATGALKVDTELTAILDPSGLATQDTAAAILAKLSADPASQTTLAAILAAMATAANQAALIAKLPDQSGGKVPVVMASETDIATMQDDIALIKAAVEGACMEEAIAIYDVRNSADKRTRLDLQRQGVTSANYSGTSEQFVTNPSGGVSGAGDRYHGLLSYEAYRLLRKYVGACLR